MGTWDSKPWDNDTAADWFGDLFDETKLRDKVATALNLELTEHQEIRAAAHMLMKLGRVYVWPINHLDEDLALAIQRLTEIKEANIFEDVPEFITEIEYEIEVLRCRLNRDHPTPNSEAFQSWWGSLVR